jgi:hypothetical protein
MAESKPIKAPRFTLGKDNKVVVLDDGKPAEGIAVFEARSNVPADESPITAMQRWSAFRQAKKAE